VKLAAADSEDKTESLASIIVAEILPSPRSSALVFPALLSKVGFREQ